MADNRFAQFSKPANRFSQFSEPEQPQRSWSDVPLEAISNIPSSAKNFAESVTMPIHSPVQFATGMRDLFAGAGSYIVGAADTVSEAVGGPDLQTPERAAQARAPVQAVGRFLKDRYGSMEGLKNTLATDPVGAAADLATVLYTGGAGLPTRAGNVVKQAASVVDPIANVGRAVRGTGTVAKHVLGTTTGAGALPIETAFEAGKRGSQTFTDNMRGYADPNDAVAMADRGVHRLKEQRSAQYQADNPLVPSPDRPDAMMQNMDTGPIKDTVAKSSGMARFQGVTYNKSAERTLNQLGSLISRFEKAPNGRSPVALDKMKQAVYDIASEHKPGTTAHKISMDVYHEIGRQIRSQVPGYDKAMADYSKMSDLINEMKRALSLNDKASIDTKTRKLQSVMRNNVNTNYGQRTRLVDELAKSEPELPAALAGQALSSATPRGLQGLGAVVTGGMGASSMNPATLATLPFFSPRLVGEGAYYTGRAAGGIGNALEAMSRAGVPANELARYLLLSRLAGGATAIATENE
jgi:hypothetical protein